MIEMDFFFVSLRYILYISLSPPTKSYARKLTLNVLVPYLIASYNQTQLSTQPSSPINVPQAVHSANERKVKEIRRGGHTEDRIFSEPVWLVH